MVSFELWSRRIIATVNGSALLGQVVLPALAEAERSFAITLGHISVEDLVHSAEGLRKSAE